MKQRGRKNSFSEATDIVVQERPAPPKELTDQERFEWLRIVNSLPAEWFQAYSLGPLSQYCKHLVNARRVSQLIEACCDREELDVKEYDKLLAMQERESRILTSLATKMRLTQQSTYSDRKTKPPVTTSKPWD